MPETFHAAFDAPVIETLAGQPIEFPILRIDDFLPWCAELKEQYRRDGLKRIPSNSNPFDRWRAETHLDKNEPWLDDLTALVPSIPGGRRVLRLSLAKAGRAADEAEAIIQAIPPWRFATLARDVSGLYPPILPYLQSSDPNVGSGDQPDAAGSANNN